MKAPVAAGRKRPIKDSTPIARPRRAARGAKCSRCGGTGKECPLPDMANMDQAEIARASKISKSLISRMWTDKPGQTRKDPKLSTLRKLQRGIMALTGHEYPLDLIAGLVE